MCLGWRGSIIKGLIPLKGDLCRFLGGKNTDISTHLHLTYFRSHNPLGGGLCSFLRDTNMDIQISHLQINFFCWSKMTHIHNERQSISMIHEGVRIGERVSGERVSGFFKRG